MAAHSRRKKSERSRRASKQPAPTIPTASPPARQQEDERLLFQKPAIAILGMIALISGSSDHATVSEVVRKCMKRGSELVGRGVAEENSVWRELFLTPVSKVEQWGVPHASSA